MQECLDILATYMEKGNKWESNEKVTCLFCKGTENMN